MMGIVFWFMTPIFPEMIAVGRLLLVAPSLLLLQSLIRDLWLLARQRRSEQTSPVKAVRCICIESTIGVTGIIIGSTLLSIGAGQLISMSEWSWSGLIILILSCGFLIKDYILEWNPWRVRREKDHMNIAFTWKK